MNFNEINVIFIERKRSTKIPSKLQMELFCFPIRQWKTPAIQNSFCKSNIFMWTEVWILWKKKTFSTCFPKLFSNCCHRSHNFSFSLSLLKNVYQKYRPFFIQTAFPKLCIVSMNPSKRNRPQNLHGLAQISKMIIWFSLQINFHFVSCLIRC